MGNKKRKTGMKRLFLYLKRYSFSLIVVCLFAIISTIFTVLAPTVMGEITTVLFDGASTGVFNWDLIVILLLSLIALYLLAQLFSFFQNFGMAKITAKVMQSLRSDIDKKMHRTKLKYYDTRTNGEILSVITNDVDTVNNAIGQDLTQIVTQVITAVGILLMMLRINLWLAIIAIIMVPISLLAAAGVMKASGKHYKRPAK